MPAEATGDSVRSAKAFVEYYIELLNYAMVTGDTTAFRAASTNCEGCNRYAALFERIEKAGGSARTDGWHVQEIAAVPQGARTAVVFDVAADAVRSQPHAGAPTTLIPPTEFELRLLVALASSGWRAVEFTQS